MWWNWQDWRNAPGWDPAEAWSAGSWGRVRAAPKRRLEHEPATGGGTRLWLDHGELVRTVWPGGITIKNAFGQVGSDTSYQKFLDQAEAAGVHFRIRSRQRRNNNSKTTVLVFGAHGNVMSFYNQLRDQVGSKMGYPGLPHTWQLPLRELTLAGLRPAGSGEAGPPRTEADFGPTEMTDPLEPMPTIDEEDPPEDSDITDSDLPQADWSYHSDTEEEEAEEAAPADEAAGLAPQEVPAAPPAILSVDDERLMHLHKVAVSSLKVPSYRYLP